MLHMDHWLLLIFSSNGIWPPIISPCGPPSFPLSPPSRAVLRIQETEEWLPQIQDLVDVEASKVSHLVSMIVVVIVEVVRIGPHRWMDQ